MTLTAIIYNEHQIIKMVHTFIGVAFLVIAIWLFYRSLRGFFQNRVYSRFDKVLSYAFIVNLYLQLIFGFVLVLSPAIITAHEMASQDSMKLAARRFWPIEHIVLMLFALFIANLGLILSSSAQKDREKHRKVVIYYSIAVILIALSLGSTYLE